MSGAGAPTTTLLRAAPGERMHAIDALRGVLMLLGVVFHACLIYQVGLIDDQFIVILSDDQASPAFDVIATFTHFFRMPCFFMVSGFFLHRSLAKRPVGAVLSHRWMRLSIPLVACAVTLMPIQHAVLYRDRGGEGGILGPYVDHAVFDPWSYNGLLSYLWFLCNLLLYVSIMSAAWPALRGVLARHPRLARAGERIAASLPGLALFAIAVLALRLFDRKLQLQGLPVYLPFFAYGMILAASDRCAGWFGRFGPLLILASLAAGAGFVAGVTLGDGSTPWKLLIRGSEAMLAFLLSSACFALFLRFAAKPNAALRTIADSSYTIYLFHQPLLLLLAWQLKPLDWHPAITFTVVTLTVSVATILIHRFLVARIRVLALLYNGRWLRRSPPALEPIAADASTPTAEARAP